MSESLFPPLDISNPVVARAVALLRTTGDAAGAEFWSDEGDAKQLIYGLAAVASELGGRYFGSLGAFREALGAWQDAGSGQLRPPDAGTP